MEGEDTLLQSFLEDPGCEEAVELSMVTLVVRDV